MVNLKNKQSIKNAIKVVFTLIFIYMLYKLVDIKEIINLYSKLSLRTIAVCLFVYFFINVGRTFRFMLTLDKKVGFFKMLPIVWVHGAYNRVLPFRIGEGIFPYLMKVHEQVEISDSSISIIVVRAFDLMSTAVLFLCAYTFYEFDVNLYSSLAICIALAILMIIMFCFGMVIFEHIFKDKGQDKKFIKKIYEVIIKKRRKLSFKNSCLLMLISILNWVLMFIIFQIIIYKFNYDVSFGLTIFAGSFSNISSILPISSLGNFGTMELGWSSILVSVGYTYSDAMLLGFSVNVCTFVFIICFGVIGMIILGLLSNREGDQL